MTFSTEALISKSKLTKRIFLHCARWPTVYFFIGLGFFAFAFFDDVFPLTRWKQYFNLTDKLALVFMVLAGVSFIYNLLVMCLLKCELRLTEKHNVATLILSSIRKALRIIFILATLNLLILFVGPSQFYLVIANNIINTILIGSVGWIALQILYTFEAIIYQKMLTLNRQEYIRVKALYTKIHIIRNIATVLIIALTIAAILMSFNNVRNIGISILASAGFITAIVGLASQKTLFSLFSGLQIALSQPIKIGDIVVIENTTGIIEEITFTYVTLKLGDRRRMLVPINYFIEKPFENWTRDADTLQNNFSFYVDYMQPIQPLRDELTRILKDSSHWDGRINKIEVANVSERSVQLKIQISAINADEFSDLRAEVREKLLDFIREHYPNNFPSLRLNDQKNILSNSEDPAK